MKIQYIYHRRRLDVHLFSSPVSIQTRVSDTTGESVIHHVGSIGTHDLCVQVRAPSRTTSKTVLHTTKQQHLSVKHACVGNSKLEAHETSESNRKLPKTILRVYKYRN